MLAFCNVSTLSPLGLVVQSFVFVQIADSALLCSLLCRFHEVFELCSCADFYPKPPPPDFGNRVQVSRKDLVDADFNIFDIPSPKREMLMSVMCNLHNRRNAHYSSGGTRVGCDLCAICFMIARHTFLLA